MVRPEKRGIFQTFLADRAGRMMAMAASLLLLVGGVTYLATTLLSRGPGPVSPGPIAIKDNKPETPTPKPEAPVAVATNQARGNADLTKGDSDMKVAEARKAAAPTAAEPKPVETPPVAVAAGNAADGPMVGPVKAPIDAALAAELARDRKLVIRVISSAAAKTPNVVADRLKKETGSPAWKLSSEISSELAAALKPEGDIPGAAKTPDAPDPPKFAGDSEAIARGLDPDFMGPPAPPSTTAPLEVATVIPSVYLVQARLDAATLAQLKSTLQKAGRADDVVFEEQRDPLPLDANSPILHPNAVLWWDTGPSGWTNWGEVPVVIDPNPNR
jgi:hypothetical protein